MNAEQEAILAAAARHWYGYGRWSAPFWFVGTKQGGERDVLSFVAWGKLGAGELLDCREHHLAIADPLFRRWHEGPLPATQPTWRSLIRVVLSYKGLDTAIDRVRDYQVREWGSVHGETAVVELSALRAQDLAADVTRFDPRADRVSTLRRRVAEHKPVFVVCYGLERRESYETLAGGPFDSEGFRVGADTIFALVPHPTSFGVGADTFVTLGSNLKRRVSPPRP